MHHRRPYVRSRALGVVALLLLAPLTSCAQDDASGVDGVHVVAGFYPLAYVAERIAGEHAEVTNLTTAGVEPHDVELSPRQAATVSTADVVVKMGGFQPALDAAAAESAAEIIDPAVAGFDTQTAVKIREDDPHFWLDPQLVADLGDAVAGTMVGTDPDHRDDYLDNAAALRTDMQELDLAYDRGLARCEGSTVVVSHDAFGYLERYGLRFVPIAGLSPSAEPSVRDLAELSDLIHKDKITTVFSETLASPKFADTLASDLGIETDVLDPIEGLAEEDTDEDYVTLMTENLAALRAAGDCA